MKSTSKIVLSASTTLYLLSSPIMAMNKPEKEVSGAPAKAAAAVVKADASSQQAAAKLKKKEFTPKDLVAGSAQTKIAAGAGATVVVTVSNDPSTYQVMYPLDAVHLSQGFRVAYDMSTENEEFNLFVLKNGGYLPQKNGSKIRTLGSNNKHAGVLEYDVQGEGNFHFVVGNNRKPVAAGAGAASIPTARVIIQNIHVEALEKASAAAATPVSAAAAASKPADKPAVAATPAAAAAKPADEAAAAKPADEAAAAKPADEAAAAAPVVKQSAHWLYRLVTLDWGSSETAAPASAAAAPAAAPAAASKPAVAATPVAADNAKADAAAAVKL